ncbi:MAG: hypothetical protein CBD31_04350 [Flavobacteriaceae bacterium TMED171]|nr:hypothetical protein [Flavobacteriaceae bacterium]OUW31474.1 MAG: hypothetical protein CBD31_04350 [Flavobacteriaceae bacterium TMED171]
MKQTHLFLFFSLIFFHGLTGQMDKKEVISSIEWEVNGQYRYFYEAPQFDKQLYDYPSVGIQPTYTVKWDVGYQIFIASAYFNWDRDENRRYWDLREFYYQKAKNNWELSVGVKRIFWGVTEASHLIDVINQSDALKSFDGEEKLGQPMVQFSWFSSNWGSLDLFYLPYHRKQGFAGEKGRFRFSTVLESSAIGYESEKKEWNPDFAARWKHYIGILDIGLSYFTGNGREPFFEFDEQGNINAFYPLVNQIGLDLQITAGALLLKFESIIRKAKQQEFFAMDAGFEFTFSNVDNNGLDIGLLGEYLYDERGNWSLTGFQNDIFYGSRVAFNDTQDTSILGGGIYDFDTLSHLFSIEATRRLSNGLVCSIEGRVFSGISDEELFLLFFKQDSYLSVSVSKFF